MKKQWKSLAGMAGGVIASILVEGAGIGSVWKPKQQKNQKNIHQKKGCNIFYTECTHPGLNNDISQKIADRQCFCLLLPHECDHRKSKQ
mgnify:CR=1 FL=1